MQVSEISRDVVEQKARLYAACQTESMSAEANADSEAIELALAKQQDGLEAVVKRAVQGAMEEMKSSVDNLRQNMEAHMEAVKGQL